MTSIIQLMCGIAGIITQHGVLKESEQSLLKEMLGQLVHRGPDQDGIISHPQVVLGNHRLKMMDQSEAGHLPMHDEEGDLVLAFNGEISNFRELILKYQLQEKYSFRSTGDTEVFLKLYRELGIEFLKELSGMFAFILHDRRKNKIFFGRDFYGINPLFFCRREGKIFIASEIKALLPVLGDTPALNVQAFYDMYTLGYIPGEATPYRDIHEISPGTFFEFNYDGNLREERYFRFSFNPKPWKENDAILATRDVLVDSVRRHLISDAPMGAMCSGGIDSSSLVGIAKSLGKSKNLHTFGISIRDQHFDESHFQKIMSGYAGTIHHQINVGLPEIIKHFDDHIAFMDEPYGHGAALPTYLLAREAQKHVKGLLSGEGGDEIFNAYETHGAHYWKKKYLQVPEPLRRAISEVVKSLPVSHEKLSLDFKLKRFTEGCELPLSHSHLFWRHLLKDEAKKDLFRDEYLPTTRISESYFNSLKHTDDFSQLSSWDIEHFFFGDLMVKNDRMCLAHSVESRFPYMDRSVTDLVMSFPAELRIKGSKRRYIQKEAMKSFLPPEIYQRQGFGLELPYNKWFMGGLSPLYERYFHREFFERLGFMHWDVFSRILTLHQHRHIDAGRFLWATLILCTWYDINHVSQTAKSLRKRVRDEDNHLRLSQI